MGHSVVKCPECGDYVMEGHNDWECDCGWYSNNTTKSEPKPKKGREGEKRDMVYNCYRYKVFLIGGK